MKQIRLGIYDVRYQPEKRAYKCSKDINGEIPRDVLKNCKFTYGRHTDQNFAAQTIEKLCKDMENVLKWAFEDCTSGWGYKRAKDQEKKLKSLCARMDKKQKVFFPKPIVHF